MTAASHILIAMRSMTGYGHAVARTEDYTIEVAVKSYNNRYLDIIKNLSTPLVPFEGIIDSAVRNVAERGHVEVSAKLKVLRSSVRINVDEGLLDEYRRAFSIIEDMTGERASVSDYLSIDGIVVPDTEVSSDIYLESFQSALDSALSAFSREKEREGEGTRADLMRLGARFKESLSSIEARSAELEDHYRRLLSEKYEALTGEKGSNPDFMQELAAILVKYSINEEVSRLRVHIAEYDKLVSSDEAVGKKLDFLCQEMQRECNTIASKSQLVEINHAVVSMKDNIEDIREQLRNIE